MFASLWHTVLDTILPPRARTLRTDALTAENIPLSPTTHELLGVQITTLMDYQQQVSRDLIQSLKYDGGSRASRLLASVVAEYLTEEIAADAAFSTKKIILAPLPLHPSRKRARGFNQIERVLQELPADLRDGSRAILRTDMLERIRATRQQTRLTRSERLSNVAGAFALSDGIAVSHCHVYIFDDVATTGATLANAATPLRKAGAEVSLIALARA